MWSPPMLATCLHLLGSRRWERPLLGLWHLRSVGQSGRPAKPCGRRRDAGGGYGGRSGRDHRTDPCLCLGSKRHTYRWGRNEEGRLGTGDGINHLAPTHVANLPPVQSVVATAAATCAITQGAEVYCWGHQNHDPARPMTTPPPSARSRTAGSDGSKATGAMAYGSISGRWYAFFEDGSVRAWLWK